MVHIAQSAVVFTGRTLGGSVLVGTIAAEAGSFRVPVYAQATDVVVEITSDSHLGLALTGAEWEGFYHKRSRTI